MSENEALNKWLTETEDGRMVTFHSMRKAVEVAFEAGQRNPIAAPAPIPKENKIMTDSEIDERTEIIMRELVNAGYTCVDGQGAFYIIRDHLRKTMAAARRNPLPTPAPALTIPADVAAVYACAMSAYEAIAGSKLEAIRLAELWGACEEALRAAADRDWTPAEVAENEEAVTQ